MNASLPNLDTLTGQEAADIGSLVCLALESIHHKCDDLKGRLKQSAPGSAYEAENRAELARLNRLDTFARKVRLVAHQRFLAADREDRQATREAA